MRRRYDMTQHKQSMLEFSTGVEPRALRDIAGCFVTGVTIITTNSEDDRPVGITANSFTSLSLAPPLILFNLDLRSRSLQSFMSCTHFAVHVLSAEQHELSKRFSTAGGPKWDGLNHSRGLHGVPIISGAHAVLQCRRHATHEGGDHTIFVGEVLAASLDESVRPLAFYRGRYCATTFDIGVS